MFLNGQKVVCIDDKFSEGLKKFYRALPVEGQTYVVRGMTVGIGPDLQEGEITVYLIGLNNPRSEKAPFRERGFKAERFRPLEEIQGRMVVTQPEQAPNFHPSL